MENKLLKFVLSSVLLLNLSVSESFPENVGDISGYNPLLLNGQPIDTERFSINSQGKLSLVKGNPAVPNPERLAFFAYVKRGGEVVNAEAYAYKHPVKELEIAGILSAAKPGDQLIIEPVNKDDVVGRRVIKVKQPVYVPQFRWFFGVNKKNDGC
jgi:hypothetical protein